MISRLGLNYIPENSTSLRIYSHLSKNNNKEILNFRYEIRETKLSGKFNILETGIWSNDVLNIIKYFIEDYKGSEEIEN